MNEVNRISLTRRRALEILGVATISPMVMAADTFPSKPIRLILPFSAGSSTDFTARTVGEKLSTLLNQPVVVDNKPGAGGTLGSQQLARSAPDGYTIGLISLATQAMVPATLKEAPYDAVRDFAPLSILTNTDLFLVTGPAAPASTLPDFVKWARSQSKPPFLGTLGAGTSGHFAGFLFGQSAKIKFEPIHFRTISDLLTAMIGGEVHAMVVAPSSPLIPHMKGGRLNALAMNGPSRAQTFPEVPTFQEVGYPDMQFLNWIGLAAPAKTPPEILDKLSAAIIAATTSPEVRTKLEGAGFRVIASKRDDFAEIIRKDVVVWKEMVKNTGFQV